MEDEEERKPHMVDLVIGDEAERGLDVAQDDANSLVTFHVGSQKQIFQVHKDAVISISPVLARMIDEGGQEDSQNVIKLPGTDPGIFAGVVAYAYNAQRADRQAASAADFTLSVGMLASFLMAKEWKYFGCLHRGGRKRLAGSTTFPSCLNCARKTSVTTPITRRCVRYGCQESGTLVGGMICEDCVSSLKIMEGTTKSSVRSGKISSEGKSKLHIRIDDKIDTFDVFRYDVPILAKELLEATIREVPTVPVSLSTLLERARTYIFAEKYGIEPLRRVTLFVLFNQLALAGGKSQNATEIVELVSYVYANTKDSGSDPAWIAKSVLRRLIVEFLAYHGDTYQTSIHMASLLHSGGELAADLFIATT